MDRTSTGAAPSPPRGPGPLAPLRALSLRTAPPLLVYLVAGASGFASIAETFWVRERLGLSAADLLALSAWLTVPWTLKRALDTERWCSGTWWTRCRSSARAAAPTCSRARGRAGALLHAAAYLALAAAAAGRTGALPAEVAYVAASLAAVVGLVVQDCVADALTTEVVDRTGPDGAPRDPDAVQAELGDVQVLGRVAAMGGAFAVAGAGGWAAGRRMRCRSRRCS